jgi:hypothetical protein
MFWNKNKRFQGWPKTTCNQDKREVKISADYLTPEGAKGRDFLSNLLTIGSIIGFLMYKKKFALGWPHFGALMLGLVIAYYLIIPFFLKARVWIIFAEDYFKVRTLFSFWKKYDRERDGYAFNQKIHEKRFTEPVIIGKNYKSYFEDAHQISLDHYQGFLILPGIYGLEKSYQLFNRLIGVELWMSDLMPRVWGPRNAPESDAEKKERGFIMNFAKKISSVMFFLYGFIGCAFLLTLLLICIPLGVGFIFGPEAEDAVYQFFKNLPDWAVVLGFLGFVSLCIYAGVHDARRLNKKFFGKKKTLQKEPDIQEAFIAIEANDIEEVKDAPKGIGMFIIKTISIILAPIAVLILGAVAFYFFGIGKQDVNQVIASVPAGFQPVAFCFVGITLGYLIQVVAKFLSKAMEKLIFPGKNHGLGFTPPA